MGSRFRFIRSSIWTDDKFPFLGDDEKLIFFQLLTSPLSNAIGFFRAGLGALAEEMRWPLERYRKGFGNLCETFGVTFEERSRSVLLRHFFRHNRPQNPNIWKAWLKCYPEVPDSPIKEQWEAIAAGYAQTWGAPYLSILYETIGERSRNVTPKVPETLPQTFEEPSPKPSRNLSRSKKGKGKGTNVCAREDLVKEQTSHLSGDSLRLTQGILKLWPTYEVMHAIQVAEVVTTQVKQKGLSIEETLAAAREAWPNDRPLYEGQKNVLHPYLASWFRNAKPPRPVEKEPYYPDLTNLED